jgi:hypothetical protein
LEQWRRRDRRHCDEECFLRTKAAARRKDAYRVLASQLRKSYGEVVLGERGGWAELARLPDEASSAGVIAAARYNQRLASPGLLEEIMAESGMIPIRLDSSMATRTCSLCQSPEVFNAVTEYEHTCGGCRNTWQIDENHCRNLLLRSGVESTVEVGS